MRRLRQWLRQDLVRKTTKSSGILLSGNLGTALFGLVSTVLMARVLGAESLGQLLFVQWFPNLVDKILNFQSWHAVIKFGSDRLHTDDDRGFSAVVRLGFLVDVGTALLGAGVAYSLLPVAAGWFDWTDQMRQVGPFFALAVAFHISGTPVGILRVLREFKIYIRQTLLAGGLKVILVGAVWYFGGGFFHLALVVATTEVLRHVLILGAAMRVMVKKGYSLARTTSFVDRREFLRFAFWTNLKASINLPVQEFDKLVVAQLVSYEALAIYRVFGQLTQFAGKISTPVNQAVYPEIASLVVSGRRRDAAKLSAKIGILLLAVLGLPAAGAAFTSVFWLGWIYSPTFADAWVVFAVMLLGRVALVSFVGLEPLFVSNGLVRESFLLSLAGALVYVPLVSGLAIWLGILGIAISNITYTSSITIPKILILKRRGLLRNVPSTT